MKFVRSMPIQTQFYHQEMNWLEELIFGRSRRDKGLNRHLFTQDFVNLFHHRMHGSASPLKLETSNNDLADRLLANIATRHRGGQTERLVELVEDIAQLMMFHGKALYFIRDHDADDAFDLISLGSERVFSLYKSFVQYVPSRVERQEDGAERKLERELRLLDRRRILLFKWPTAIRRMISAQNKIFGTLDRYDGSLALALQPQATHENPNPHTYFNFTQWREAHDMAFYRATRATGWNGRKYDSEKRSDFFDCHRLIRFRRVQVIFRDSILKQLSRELTRIGKVYGGSFSLSIEASEEIVSINQLNELEGRLRNEQVGFKEVIDFCYQC
ncbi:hypothetical protein [Agrobacterium tumefaciens]|uniref:hypothetical protein n=1 Tax=Agrobacterium tumefaciens TaxID=358 RepID=UPI0021D1988C|nr:hypothetical protein [Agrobacterium tumefaciens]UXS01322.1 hypothetical protein FY156_07430 [Agrobacterium tumefaciens]